MHDEAPAGQFESALCAPRVEGADQPTEVTVSNPETPSSITLSSCDAHIGVRVTLHRTPDAGTLVALQPGQTVLHLTTADASRPYTIHVTE